MDVVYEGDFDKYLNTYVYVVFLDDEKETLAEGVLLKPCSKPVAGAIYFLKAKGRFMIEPLKSDASVYADKKRERHVGYVFAPRELV